MLISEVILENFMSYEYARVPFRSGVNVVCGPNGSGKSSLLLAISVALGQSHTERSRKLSDLIRWGKDHARVTLVLSNVKKGNRRPVPRIRKDEIYLTRVLRKDGKYWFELENRAATKARVDRLLSKLGVDPDNMLIIMHQNMVEQFTVLPAQEKLKMVEAAVGLESYRKNVLKAQKKLTRLTSQENSINKLLESARQTLNYWREQYDKYQEKKQLNTKRRFLERELAWAEVIRNENNVKTLETNIREEEKNLKKIQDKIRQATNQLVIHEKLNEKLKGKWKNVFNDRINLERSHATCNSTVSICEQLLDEISVLDAIQISNPTQSKVLNPGNYSDPQGFLRYENLKKIVENSQEQIQKLDTEINENKSRMEILDKRIEKGNQVMLQSRIDLAIMQSRENNINDKLEKSRRELEKAKSKVAKEVENAKQVGPRIAVVKSVSEIIDDIRVTDGHLAALSDVTQDVERMYESYSKIYLELKVKAEIVAENREKTLEETSVRLQAWRSVIKKLLEQVSQRYEEFITRAQATGEIKLVNDNNVDDAGLDILVGFKGGRPVPLDAYTQSGGERTTATMSFLLALQQHVRSPFRAVDEYDIHMDPVNRELVAETLISAVEDSAAQYVILTPSQITFANEAVYLITVQNIEGRSIIREVA
ncbi:MAG: AAA family ATPase [Candidatus Bathyarchaeota archaeon]|jgi:chromosome segregation protein